MTMIIGRLVRMIGPWPLHPVVLGLSTAVVYLIAVLGVTAEQPVLDNNYGVIGRLVPIGAGVVIGLIAAAGRAWQQRRGVDWVSYLVCVAVMALVAPIVRSLTPSVPELPGDTVSTLTIIVRGAALILVINGLAGHVTGRLERQIEATQQALDLSYDQQRKIIAADEEARRQASLLLHDRVQARLITICLELRGIAERLEPDDRHDLLPLIERLEEVRSLDLRTAARSLSPNLEDIDLQTALEDLAVQYESVVGVQVHVDPKVDDARAELGVQMALACYRIVEQGLINAAAHAKASEVLVRVMRTKAGLRVEVSDDGRGMSASSGRGLGSALIGAWARALGGDWGWRPRPDGTGTVLFAEFSVAVADS